MKLREKMLLAFVGLAFLAGFVGYLANSSLKEITTDIVQLRKSSIIELESSADMVAELTRIEGTFKEYIYETADGHPSEIVIAKIKLKKSLAGFEKALESRSNITADGLHLYTEEELEEENEELAEIDVIKTKYNAYKKEILTSIADYETKGVVSTPKLYEKKWKELDSTLMENVQSYKEETQEEITYETTEVENKARKSTQSMILIAIGAFIIAITAGFFITKSIVDPILRLKEAAQKVALGNMDNIQHSNIRDEIGDLIVSFNMMTVDLKKSRMEIEQHNNTLEQKVHERTLELEENIEKLTQTEVKLKAYTESLKRSNLELEQFAYVASHDLQEPLRTTTSFVELLLKEYKGKLDAKADKYLGYITQASDRMGVLIKDLLDYSRIGHKKELQKVDCNKIVQNVLADLGAAIQEVKAHLVSDPLPIISGYPTEIKQLFQNLIANSIKFRKKGTIPEIKITAQLMKGHWEFKINDNGIGIQNQHSKRIFTIFQRLHNRTEYEGTGIGLAHCKKIVELHNGRIWVESAFGEGSTFYFTIPEKIRSNIYEKEVENGSVK